MNQKIRVTILGIYDLILAIGAIYSGVLMIRSSNGIFIDYPKEWLFKVPFESWLIPGIIAIIVFGLGNIIAAIFSLRNQNDKSCVWSAIMGGIFFISLIFQVIILGEWYLATVEFLVFSIIQLCLSVYAFDGYKKI